MKIFISWSGERSQRLAQALHGWLPLVLHYVKPWLSEADVSAGDRWAQAVATELETSNFGVICVTPENLGSPWVLFEAGALAKTMQGTRGLDVRFRDLESVVMEHGPRSRHRRFRKFHPMMFEEMAEMVSKEADDPISLLMFGGLVRDDFPWLYEVLVEVYREVRDGDAKAALRAIERLRRVTRVMGRDPFMDEMIGSSKEAHMMMMELPRMLDHFLQRFETRRLRVAPDADSDESETSTE
jgi:hypothetical protein